MADASIRKIKRKATTRDIEEYLDYLQGRLSFILENLDEENLTEEFKRKIGD